MLLLAALVGHWAGPALWEGASDPVGRPTRSGEAESSGGGLPGGPEGLTNSADAADLSLAQEAHFDRARPGQGSAPHCAGSQLPELHQTRVPAWLAQQTQHAEPLAQAVAWTLSSAGVGLTPARVVCKNGLCSPSVAGTERRTAQLVAQRAQALPALVHLALASGQPAVFAMAWQACRSAGASAAPACAGLQPAQWVAMAPASTSAWLALADQARARGDEAAAEAALHRAVQLPRLQLASGELPRGLLAALPADWPTDLQSVLIADAVVSEAVMGADELRPVMQHCQDERLAADGARLGLCRQWADLLTAQAPDPMSALQGLSLAARTGWPAEQVQSARSDLQQLMSSAAALLAPASAASGIDDDGPQDCVEVVRQQAHLERIARLGELAALRTLVADAARTPAAPAAPAR